MHVELATPAHDGSLVDLLCELHAYYHEGVLPSRAMVEHHLATNLRGPGSPLRLAVAVDTAGTVIGLAAVTLTFSLVDPTPNLCRQMHLKELYVREGHRGSGAGTALMRWITAYALEHGCGRMDWPVIADNARGRAFYERLGAVWVAGQVSYRMTGQAMRKLCGMGRPA